MACAPEESSEKIKLWASDNEESEKEERLYEDLVENVPVPKTETKKKVRKPETIPPWRTSESVFDLTELKEDVKSELKRAHQSNPEPEADLETYSWSADFKLFTGKPLPFTGTAGPTVETKDPFTLFTSIWDRKIMSLIAEETNRYARQTAKLQEGLKMPTDHVCLDWTDTTVEELYVFFALHVFASCKSIEPYVWQPLRLPSFPLLMKENRFFALTRFLHFVDNENLGDSDKKLAKIKPILDHCNEKFASLYYPRQYLHVDYSFLLYKNQKKQALRLQANRFGLRTYELSEVFTGYVLKVLQYPGDDQGLTSKDKAQIVLDLAADYSHKGHRLVTYPYFSSVSLARTLKSKGFDYIGKVPKNRKDLPEIIQNLKEDVKKREVYNFNGNTVRMVSRHCEDVSVTAWSEGDITALSTFHTSEMKTNDNGIRRPAVTVDFTKVREKIQEKDEDLAEYIMVRQPSERWYMRQFKNLLNISLRNIFIIHKRNSPGIEGIVTNQVNFRHALAYQVLEHFADKDLVYLSISVSIALGSGVNSYLRPKYKK